MQLAGSEHIDDVAHPSTALLNKVVPGVDCELPDRRGVLAQAQRCLQIELRGASIAMLSGMLGPATGSMVMSTTRPWVISSLMQRSKSL